MKKRGRHEQCKHAIQAFDEIVLVDLDCPQYSLICGTAIVTKRVCKYCPCMEKRDDSEKVQRRSEQQTALCTVHERGTG